MVVPVRPWPAIDSGTTFRSVPRRCGRGLRRFKRGQGPLLRRVDTADGDFLDLDWLGPAMPDPLVVILHGLEGSSSSHYVRALAHGLAARGLASVVMHQRGCSGEPNRLARFYHAGETEDLRFVLEHCRRRRPGGRLYAVGYSLGGNVVLKWLGQAQDSLLDAAAAVFDG